MKEALIVGLSGAAGTWVSQKYGAQLEAQAAKLSIPPTIAHMVVVGGFVAVTWFVAEKIL